MLYLSTLRERGKPPASVSVSQYGTQITFQQSSSRPNMVKQAVALGVLSMGEFKDGEMTSKGRAPIFQTWVSQRTM